MSNRNLYPRWGVYTDENLTKELKTVYPEDNVHHCWFGCPDYNDAVLPTWRAHNDEGVSIYLSTQPEVRLNLGKTVYSGVKCGIKFDLNYLIERAKEGDTIDKTELVITSNTRRFL